MYLLCLNLKMAWTRVFLLGAVLALSSFCLAAGQITHPSEGHFSLCVCICIGSVGLYAGVCSYSA